MGVAHSRSVARLIDLDDPQRWVKRTEGEATSEPYEVWWCRIRDAERRVLDGLTDRWLNEYMSYLAGCYLEYALMHRATCMHMFFDPECRLFRTLVYMPIIGFGRHQIAVVRGAPDIAGRTVATWSWPFPETLLLSLYPRKPSRWAWRWTWVELLPLFSWFRHVLRQLRFIAGIQGHRRFGGFQIRYHGTLLDASAVAARTSDIRLEFVPCAPRDSADDNFVQGRVWPEPSFRRQRARSRTRRRSSE